MMMLRMHLLLCSLAFLVIITAATAFDRQQQQQQQQQCGAKEWEEHPVLCHMLERLRDDRNGLATEIYWFASQHHHIVGQEYHDWEETTYPVAVQRRLGNKEIEEQQQQQQQLPVVFAHGMGDSCFNDGMKRITQRASDLLGGVYAVCIPTGKTHEEDTTNGYFLNMDASVDVFASAVAADPQLAGGFHAIGFSQGANIIRGYVGRYNTPTVNSMISVNGPVAGVGAVPYCRPSSSTTTTTIHTKAPPRSKFDMCDLLMEQASRSAYTSFAQQHSFQANYWRDPRASGFKRYQEYGQLAVWNNEVGFVNETLRENFSRTSSFVWVMATEDNMVWPKEGEHWACPDPANPFHHILPMKTAPWYQNDLFGLRTAEESGKNHFESFVGDHLQFSLEDFDRWITQYFKN